MNKSQLERKKKLLERKAQLEYQLRLGMAKEDYASYVELVHQGQYSHAKHTRLVCEKLQEIHEGKLKRLAIFMPPRHSKCCDPESEVFTPNGIVKIKNISIGDEVFCFDNGKLTKSIVTNKDWTKKSVVEIKTRSGIKVKISPEHRMLTQNGYKQAKDLTETDFLIRFTSQKISKQEIDVNEVKFIAHLIFEGSLSQRAKTYTNFDSGVVNDFVESAKNLGILVKKYPCKEGCYHVSNKDGKTNKILDKYGINNQLCYHKRLPKEFFFMKEEYKWAFVDVMIGTDGYVAEKSRTIGVALANEGLICDIQLLLSGLGVYSTKTYKHNDKQGAWCLQISGKEIMKIYEHCSLFHKRIKVDNIISNCNMIEPYLVYPNEFVRHLKNTRKNGFRVDNSKNVKIERWEKLKKVYPELVVHEMDDFFYDSISEINRLEETIDMVDIGVEKYNNFILNGLVSHNSQTVTESFPSWYIGKNPDRRVIQVSYGDDLAVDFGLKNRQKIDEYGKLFGVSLDDDKQAKGDWAIKGRQGYMRSGGILSPITGKGANLLIIDDPVKNDEEAASQIIRDRIWNAYQGTLLTRLTPDGAIVLIMTRWHEDDLAGRILKEEKGWEVINLPCEAEENDLLGREIEEPLWPEFGFNKTWIKDMKTRVGSRVWNALYQQRPSSAEGELLKRKWWQRYTALPQMAVKLISVDATFKDKETSDFVSIGVWGKAGPNMYLIDKVKARMDFPTTLQAIIDMKSKHPDVFQILIEDKANGSAIIQVLRTKISGIIAVEPQGGKVARVNAISPQVEAGNVFLPNDAPWVSDFIEECAAFPNGKHDDDVDMASQAISRMMYMPAALPENKQIRDDFGLYKKEKNAFEMELTQSYIEYGLGG